MEIGSTEGDVEMERKEMGFRHLRTTSVSLAATASSNLAPTNATWRFYQKETKFYSCAAIMD